MPAWHCFNGMSLMSLHNLYVPWEFFGTTINTEDAYDDFASDILETIISRALNNPELKDEELRLLFLFPLYRIIADIDALTEEQLIDDPDNKYANVLRLIHLYRYDDIEDCLPEEKEDIEEAYRLASDATDTSSFSQFVRGYYHHQILHDLDTARSCYKSAAEHGNRQAMYQLSKLGEQPMLRESLKSRYTDEIIFLEFSQIVELVIELHKQLGKDYNPLY